MLVFVFSVLRPPEPSRTSQLVLLVLEVCVGVYFESEGKQRKN